MIVMDFIIVVGVLVGLGFVTFIVGIVKATVRGGRPTGPYSGTHPTQLSTWQDGTTTPYDVNTAVPPHSGHHGGHHQHHDSSPAPTHSSHDMGSGGHHHG
jgi:hypothetical protein